MKYLKKFSLFEASKNIYKPLETIGFKFIGTETPEKNVLVDIFENKDKEKLYVINQNIEFINVVFNLYKLGFKIKQNTGNDNYKNHFKYKNDFKVFGFNTNTEKELIIMTQFYDHYNNYRYAINGLIFLDTDLKKLKNIINNKNNLRTFNDYFNTLKKIYNCYNENNTIVINYKDYKMIINSNPIYDNFEKGIFSFNIKYYYEFIHNEIINKLLEINTDYFDVLIGLSENDFIELINPVLENLYNKLENLINKMQSDDEYFHEIKDKLPNDIINKYLERINNNDSLI